MRTYYDPNEDLDVLLWVLSVRRIECEIQLPQLRTQFDELQIVWTIELPEVLHVAAQPKVKLLQGWRAFLKRMIGRELRLEMERSQAVFVGSMGDQHFQLCAEV